MNALLTPDAPTRNLVIVEREKGPPIELVNALGSELDAVLGADLVGLYLYGSSVAGGFEPGISDVDLVAVSASELAASVLVALERMHERVGDRFPEWRDRIEVVYVSRATLGSFRTSAGALAVISPGEPFHVRDDPASEWLQNWYLVRKMGVPLRGAAARDIIAPIAWTEFVAAAIRYADELRRRDRVGVTAGEIAYTVLILCRALRTVRTDKTGSKQEAAAWVRDRMPDWAWLIEAALVCRQSRGRIGFADAASRASAETFIRLIVDEIVLAPARTLHW